MTLLPEVSLQVREDQTVKGCLDTDGLLHHPVLATSQNDHTGAPPSPAQECGTGLGSEGWRVIDHRIPVWKPVLRLV